MFLGTDTKLGATRSLSSSCLQLRMLLRLHVLELPDKSSNMATLSTWSFPLSIIELPARQQSPSCIFQRLCQACHNIWSHMRFCHKIIHAPRIASRGTHAQLQTSHYYQRTNHPSSFCVAKSRPESRHLAVNFPTNKFVCVAMLSDDLTTMSTARKS